MVGKRTMQDELRPEYDLRNLQVRTVAPNRKRYGRFVVHLEPDVAKAFPNATSVNEVPAISDSSDRRKQRVTS